MKKLISAVSLFIPVLLLCFILFSCARKPLAEVPKDCLPELVDDMHLESLEAAIETNLEYLRKQDPQKKIILAERTYTVARLVQSQEFFLKLIAAKPAADELTQRIREHFDVFQATGTSGINLGRKMLVTGYFQPVFEGKLEKGGEFQYPLYSVPPDFVRKKDDSGKITTGRLENSTLVPYWTRAEIELQQKAVGYELVWLKDPFDAFVLHVQGSGVIRLPDGSLRGIQFAAKNGHTYRSIGKYMVETGRIRLEDAGLKTIRQYLEKHPEERNDILHHNPSFIFFNWSETQGAIGNLGKVLTAGRSIAVDQDCFPAGALGFLFSRKPVPVTPSRMKWRSLNRFVVVQDTGSAIRGPGRVDLFWGAGENAGFEAGQMKEPGTLYFFILKDSKDPNSRGSALVGPSLQGTSLPSHWHLSAVADI